MVIGRDKKRNVFSNLHKKMYYSVFLQQAVIIFLKSVLSECDRNRQGNILPERSHKRSFYRYG